MAVPHVEGRDARDKRWGEEVAHDDLDSLFADPDKLAEYRERITQSGRAAAERLRSDHSTDT